MKHNASIFIAFGWAASVGCTAPTDEEPDSGSGSTSGSGEGSGRGDGDRDGDIALPGPGEPEGELRPGEKCTPKVIGLLRDFQAGGDVGTCPVNADFQNSWMNPVPDIGWQEPGIPAPQLGADKKPVHSGGTFQTVTSEATFHAWYRDDPHCNHTFEHEIVMETDPVSGNLVFDSDAFFPLDGIGFGNSGQDDYMQQHNFHFTFELHMTFTYRGGEVFRFRGDDDLFVFINDALSLDLGGVHAPQEGSISLDDLGLTVGEIYPIDFFHAERSTSQSNFRIETSLEFENCTPIFVDVVK